MRRNDREVTDPERIHEIIAHAGILHLGLFDEEYPYVVPMHYGCEWIEDLPVFYMHCANEGHKLDLIRWNPHCSVELECDLQMISGEDNPCAYGSAYASVMARGKVEIVTDFDAKIHALKVFMKQQTGRDFAFTEAMAASVAILKVTVSELSAKERKAPHGMTGSVL